MTRIPRLTAQRVIDAFFGRDAKPYAYTVTQDDFDEYDNEAAGEYFGVEVPAEMARRWDAGIDACRTGGIEPGSADGWRLRLSVMYPDGIPAGAAESVEAYRAERERKAAEAAEARARPQREYDVGMAEIAKLTAGLTPTGYGPALYRDPMAPSGWACHWHVFCHAPDPTVSPRVEPLGMPMVKVYDWFVNRLGHRALRAVCWRTAVGYIVEDPSVHVTTHYVSAELATEYRLRWAQLNGVDRAQAEAGKDSPNIGADQRAMYLAVLAS